MKDIEVTCKKTFEDQDIKDLLCCAFEGGSNYWYHIQTAINPDKIECEFRHLDLPMSENGYLIIKDIEDDDDYPELYKLNRQSIEKGLQIMADKYPEHFHNFDIDNADAETGDVFLQCCLFGEIVFE
ncbi:hypothetical protein D4R86_04795 [bacterium]|nr:MAG: hypothetical protein D4R86_04795 [bacterium]